ncbi:MAG: Lpg1974 family pore-forming outer membrane protein [Waddliaceae bacterium]
MKKRCKILSLWTIFVAQTLLAASAYANTDNYSEFDGYNGCFGNAGNSFGVGLGADFLWWKPCVDNLDYAIKFAEPTSESLENNDENEGFLSDIKSIHLDWEPGVRVMAWAFNRECNWGAGASWTYVKICDTASIRITEDQFFNDGISIMNPFVIGQSGIAARGSFDACYHDWDLLALHSCFYGNCHRISPYAGVAGMVFNQKINDRITPVGMFENSKGLDQEENGDSIPTKWRGDYWGVGFRVGLCYEFAFSRCFNFFAKADGSLLAGKVNRNRLSTQAQIRGTFVDASYNDPRNRCHFVPGYHIAAGFTYDVCLYNLDLLLRLGYEFVNWHNLSSPRILVSQTGNLFPIATNTRTLSFHGLLAGLGISF